MPPLESRASAPDCDASPPPPFVSVIIPHLNDQERLVGCLELLRRQTYPHDRFEVIVVDNGSTRPLDSVLERFPEVIATSETERGCGTARNRGVAISRGDILAFTDADCLPEPTWLANAVRMFRDGAGPEIVGGEIIVFAADESRPTDVELYEKVFGFQQADYVLRKSFAAGANIVTRRAVFDRVGPFRNGKVPEDLEWGRRAGAAGCRLAFGGDAVVRHPARRNWEELRWKMDRTVFHNLNLMKERPLFHLRWLTMVALLSVPPVDKLWEVARSPRLHGFSERVGAARTLFRLRYYRVLRMLRYLFDRETLGREHYSP